VVSFYTTDEYYSSNAKTLIEECKNLHMDYIIVEKGYMGGWSETVSIKPSVILQAMKKVGPVLWLDCDNFLLKRPDAVSSEFDMMAAPKNPEKKRPFYMGCMYFNGSEKSMELVSNWINEADTEKREEITFHNALQATPGVKTGNLPMTYMHVMTEGEIEQPDDVVLHGLSKSKSKDEFIKMSKLLPV